MEELMHTRLIPVLLVCLTIATSCGQKGPTQRKNDYTLPEGTVKVISYNIRQSGLAENDGPNAWDKRKDATLNMIEAEAPSLFGLQEALPDQLAYISAAFPQYDRIGVGRDDGKEEGECMAIYYCKEAFELIDGGTFWLSETPGEVSMGWDAACHRTVTWVNLREAASGKTFFYLNTHLDHQGEKAREESVKLLSRLVDELVPDGVPVALGGDLNSGIDSPIFDPFREINLLSARELAPKTSNAGTFNAWGSAPSGIVLDHIFIRDAKALEFSTLNGDYGAPFISDHYPIELTFEL